MCGKPLLGRSGKKFCSPECKNAFHNRESRAFRLYRSRIITALGRNYEILREALDGGVLSVDLMSLENKGFRPSFVTGYIPIRYGNDCCRCFDISYCRSSTRIFKIRRDAEEF